MLSLFIIFLLGIGVIIGLRRGLILQLVHLFGFFIAFIIASVSYKALAAKLPMWIAYPQFDSTLTLDLLFDTRVIEKGFYNAIAFVLIFIIAKVTLQIVASLFDFLASLPVLKQFNKYLGAFLGFSEIYIIVLLLLTIAATVQVVTVQHMIQDSFVAKQMITNTPILSEILRSMWF